MSDKNLSTAPVLPPDDETTPPAEFPQEGLQDGLSAEQLEFARAKENKPPADQGPGVDWIRRDEHDRSVLWITHKELDEMFGVDGPHRFQIGKETFRRRKVINQLRTTILQGHMLVNPDFDDLANYMSVLTHCFEDMPDIVKWDPEELTSDLLVQHMYLEVLRYWALFRDDIQ